MKNDKTPITRKKAEREILLSPVRVESAKATMIKINARKHTAFTGITRYKQKP
jgi:hypothetical protein